jgi:amino acid transporter
LICATLAILIGAIAAIAGRDRFRIYDEEHRFNAGMILRVSTVIVGITALAVFFLTEDWNQPHTVIGEWTLLVFFLFLVTLVLTIVRFGFFDGRKDRSNR